MANIVIERIWRSNIYQWETSDPLLGGVVAVDGNGDIVGPPAGLDNIQGKQLGDRTAFLKWRTMSSEPGKRNTVLAGKLAITGLAAFLSVAGPEVLASNVDPLILTFSGGYDQHGPINYYKFIEVNTPIVSLTGAVGDEFVVAEYDPVTDAVRVNSTGEGFYIGAGDPGAAVYRYWWNPVAMKFYKSDMVATWTQIYGVYLGSVDYTGVTNSPIEPGDSYVADVVPVGTVHAFASDNSNLPVGYLICDGSDISRVDYARLFKKLGVYFGIGDGSTTFTLPDLQGYFIRGFQALGGPDAGRIFGSTQLDGVGPHNHFPDNYGDFLFWDPIAPSFDIVAGTGGMIGGVATSGVDIIAETRPLNVAMNYIIKY